LFLINELKGKARNMIKQKDSAEVLENAFSEAMDEQQRQQVLFEIYSPELAALPDSKPLTLRAIFAQKEVLRNQRICEDLQSLLDLWCQKELLKNSIVHAVMWEYCQCIPDSRKEAFIQSLRDLVVHFCHTSDGSKVANFIVAYGSAKDRKAIVKGIKPNVADLAIDEFGVVPLLRVLDCMDDTRTVGDAILKPLLKDDVLG
jgi:pumilio family protein 6